MDALKIDECHENVGTTLTNIKRVPKEEEKIHEDILEKAKLKSNFFRKFGRAASLPDAKRLHGNWEGPDCVLELSIKDGAFVATGSYQSKPGLMAFAFMGTPGIQNSGAATPKYNVEYKGTLRGRAIMGRVSREKEGAKQAASVLTGSSDDDKKILMVITEDETEIFVMEGPLGKTPRYYSLEQQSDD